MKSILLSKSKYMSGLQCSKYLWLLFHDPSKVSQPDASTQHVFDEGHRIGELAWQLFPNGVPIPTDDFRGNLTQTKDLLKKRQPLFEPAVFIEGIYSRLDILNTVGSDEWDIVEVKGSTKVKDENINDVSFQRLCAQKAGLKIRKCFLVHINNQYVRSGEIESQKFFATEDISAEVDTASAGIEDRIKAMFDVISATDCPDMLIGGHCGEPYPCPVTSCWDNLPEHHIFELYRGGKKCSDLYSQGVLTIKDIPDGFKLSASQTIQKECIATGDAHIEKEAIAQFINSLTYPVYYFDFETINPAIPLYDGTRPFQRIPFQFSLHVVATPSSTPEHYSFLADGADDPRPKLLAEMKRLFGDKGSIVVYNQSFERSVMQELRENFPEYKDWLDGLCSRLVDLYEPFRNFQYYNLDQHGSASIKEVLPAVTGKSYKGMEIAHGDDASLAFFALTSGTLNTEERKTIQSNLEKYCGLDTEGMIWIVNQLKNIGGTTKL